VHVPPNPPAAYLTLTTLIRSVDPAATAGRTAARMVALAGNAAPGAWLRWQLAAPRRRRVLMQMWAGGGIETLDLAWVLDGAATTSMRPTAQPDPSGWSVSEVLVPAASAAVAQSAQKVGFSADVPTAPILAQDPLGGSWAGWPRGGITVTEELIAALKVTGGIVRVGLRPCSATEAAALADRIQRTWPSGEADRLSAYLGRPVHVLLLVATPTRDLPARLRAVLNATIPGIGIGRLGFFENAAVATTWQTPETFAPTMPAGAAHALALAPAIGGRPVLGVAVSEPKARLHPAHHREPHLQRVRLGTAITTAGARRAVHLSLLDATRHMQITGQTGTGKSTLLTTMCLRAARAGNGLTLLDPHGATVDRVQSLADETIADRILTVRLGDLANPVAISPWSTHDPVAAEPAINEMLDLLRELFDPHAQGIVGPRFERWFSLNAQANIALLGTRASLTTMVALARDQQTTRALAQAISADYPGLAARLTAEYGNLRDQEAGEMISWAVSKLQRLTATAHLRAMLGTGANALDLQRRIEDHTVLLIDLAMPTIGAAAARTAGMLVLQQLWTAVTARTDRDSTHLLLLDEAHLFQHGPLPSMLTEGRKFGLGVVVTHNHADQLVPDVRNALDANSASLVAFRSSAADAARLAPRLGAETVGDLPRLPAFQALSSLCVDGAATRTFTLTVDQPPKPAKGTPDLTKAIARRSHQVLVDPYRRLTPLEDAEIFALLKAPRPQIPAATRPGAPRTNPVTATTAVGSGGDGTDFFLDESARPPPKAGGRAGQRH
jgi:hypothetical protein